MRTSDMKTSSLIIAFAAALLAACGGPPRPAEEVVAERAQARWDALVEKDFEAAWQYYTPGFRKQMPADDFADDMSKRPVKWTGAEVRETECSESEPRCEVRSRVDYRVPARIPGAGPLESRTGVTEIWLQIDGEWWYSADA